MSDARAIQRGSGGRVWRELTATMEDHVVVCERHAERAGGEGKAQEAAAWRARSAVWREAAHIVRIHASLDT